MIACMGGFCNSRDRCAYYYSDSKVRCERLCGDIEEVELLPRDDRKEKDIEKNMET